MPYVSLWKNTCRSVTSRVRAKAGLCFVGETPTMNGGVSEKPDMIMKEGVGVGEGDWQGC